MQAHIDRLEQVDGMLKRTDSLLVEVDHPTHSQIRGEHKLRDARRVLRLTIDDLSLEDGNGDAEVDIHAAEDRSLSEEVEMLVADLRALNQQTRCRYYDLAIRITREPGHPFIADEIKQCLYNEARKEGSK